MIEPANRFMSAGHRQSEPTISVGFVVEGAHDSKVSSEISYHSRVVDRIVSLATRYASSSASVIILGESGTGKELFSRLIHRKSNRSAKPFVAVNCAAIPEQLIESEIFGHERGAFTGAIQSRTGYFQRAHGGTLLLDEVSEIPVKLQAKLLRVIEEKEVQPVGSDRATAIDVRIVATSNRDLSKEVDEGRFRRDLYHRLNVLELCLPPLRERRVDIPLLTMRFIEMFQHESPEGIVKVSKEAMEQLCNHDWPGNIRELRNVIHRACVVAENCEIAADSLPKFKKKLGKPKSEKVNWTEMPLAEVEQKLIIACLQKFDGNKNLAAEVLGVTPRTLSNKIKQYREKGSFPNI
ncbi:MAG: sigma-54 interaction domain-containing protein [Mariniblastus sp.]